MRGVSIHTEIIWLSFVTASLLGCRLGAESATSLSVSMPNPLFECVRISKAGELERRSWSWERGRAEEVGAAGAGDLGC
jgi:hypothetical protein